MGAGELGRLLPLWLGRLHDYASLLADPANDLPHPLGTRPLMLHGTPKLQLQGLRLEYPPGTLGLGRLQKLRLESGQEGNGLFGIVFL